MCWKATGLLNYFSPLNRLTKERKKNNTPHTITIEDIPSHSNFKNPKFIVNTPTDPKIPLTYIIVFIIKKSIAAISSSYEYITQLLIVVKSLHISNLFLSKNNLSGHCPVSISLHKQPNCSKGTAYAPAWLTCLKVK